MQSTSATTTATTLLTLPPELRTQIYSYLTPPSRLPTILRSRCLGVSSVSHRPPPLNFLLTCRQLYHEALEHYYRIAVFKIEGIIDSANVWPMWQVEEVLAGTEAGKAILGRMRRVELGCFWNRVPGGGVGGVVGALANVNAVYGGVCRTEVQKRRERVQRVVEVLGKAERLSVLSVTWKEIPPRKDEESEEWDVKQGVLEPLRAVRGVRFLPRDVVAGDEVEERLIGFLRELDNAASLPIPVSSTATADAVEGGSQKRGAFTPPSERGGQYLCTPEDRDKKISYFEWPGYDDDRA